MIRFDVDEQVVAADGVVLWPVYSSVFDDQPDYLSWRGAVWDRHSTRAGFRLARAYDDDHLVGFAYGYTGAPGQW